MCDFTQLPAHLEWKVAADLVETEMSPLIRLAAEVATVAAVKRIKVSPFCYRRLLNLLSERERAAERAFGHRSLPEGVPVRPSLFGIPIEESGGTQ